MSDQETARALGRLEGKLDAVLKNQDRHHAELNSIDKRLQAQERKSAVVGTVGGTVAGIGVSLLAQMFKANIG